MESTQIDVGVAGAGGGGTKQPYLQEQALDHTGATPEPVTIGSEPLSKDQWTRDWDKQSGEEDYSIDKDSEEELAPLAVRPSAKLDNPLYRSKSHQTCLQLIGSEAAA